MRRWPTSAFVRGNALHLPFKDGSIDLVVSVEASHAYGDDAAFLREVGACCAPGAGSSMRITAPVARCARWSSWRAPPGSGGAARHHDQRGQRLRARRRAAPGDHPIRLALVLSPVFAGSLERYSGLPGTATFERFRSGDRMYFLTCMRPQE